MNVESLLLLAGILVVVLALWMWFRIRRRSSFQARLAVLFFILIVLPVLPLSWLASHYLAKSTEILTLPQVERALVRSLEEIRSQLNDRGQRVLREIQDSVTSQTLAEYDLDYYGVLELRPDSVILISFRSGEPGFKRTFDRSTDFQERHKFGYIAHEDTSGYFEAYRFLSDSMIAFAGYRMPGRISSVVKDITAAHRQFSALSLLHQTFVEQRVIGIVLLVFVLLLSLLSLALSRWIASGVSEPIRKLSAAMKQVGQGDLSQRVKFKGKGEMAFLIHTFNIMADELEENRKQLQRFERAAAWRDIARQVSHEIKNPLTPIEISLYRLEQSLSEKESARTDVTESLRIIKEEIASIRQITTEFSQFARMPLLQLAPKSVTLAVKDSVELFNNQQDRIDIKLEAEDKFVVDIDEQQFKRVMHNLLKNALEASQPGQIIQVKIERGGNGPQGICVKVADQGCGMDESTVARIFEPDFTTKKTGSGIGLFVAEKIVSDHGGQLRVQSRQGEGTVFTMML